MLCARSCSKCVSHINSFIFHSYPLRYSRDPYCTAEKLQHQSVPSHTASKLQAGGKPALTHCRSLRRSIKSSWCMTGIGFSAGKLVNPNGCLCLLWAYHLLGIKANDLLCCGTLLGHVCMAWWFWSKLLNTHREPNSFLHSHGCLLPSAPHRSGSFPWSTMCVSG